jgi:PAS domain S-box-containing protein
MYKAEDAIRYESRARDMVASSNYLLILSDKTEDAADYFIGTGLAWSAADYWKFKPVLDAEMASLLEESKEFPECTRAAENLDYQLKRNEDFWTRMVTLRSTNDGNLWIKSADVRHSAARTKARDELLQALLAMQEATSKVVKTSTYTSLPTQATLMSWLGVALGFNTLLAILMSLVFSKGITARLAILVDNSRRLALGQALNPALQQIDEIGCLDSMFHKMADELDQSARKERALTDNAKDVIFSLEKGKFIKLNPAVTESWGYKSEELLGQTPAEIIVGDVEQFEAELNTIAKDGLSVEVQIQRKDGSVLDTLWSTQWSEQDECLFCVAHDISERKKNEQLVAASELRMKTVLNSTLVGVLTSTEAGLIESANPRIEQLLGYGSDSLIGKPISVLFPNSSNDSISVMEQLQSKLAKLDAEVTATGEKQNHVVIELDAITEAGKSVPVELSVSPLEFKDSKILLLTVVDIRARRELQQAKQEFGRMIGEDLGIPLNSIQTFLQDVSNEKYCSLLPLGKNRASIATNNIGRLIRLLDDLFEMNELEAGQLELRPGPVLLADIVQRSVDAVRVFAEKHKVKLQQSSPTINLVADGDRLERVLVNFLSNAVKFSPEGETVSIHVEDQIENVKVKVIDHGRGIPASHIDSIFAAFKQVTATDASKKGGTGLGLAICKAVIEQHGGTIGVDSVEGKGSTFWFCLPKPHANV